MMKVFLHTRTSGKFDWDNRGIQLLDFARLPVVGDYISLDNGTSNWHRVELVVHVAQSSPASEYMAEVYCVAEDHLEALKRARRDNPD